MAASAGRRGLPRIPENLALFILLGCLAVTPPLAFPFLWKDSSGYVTLEKDCPLFPELSIDAPVIGVAAEKSDFKSLESRKYFLSGSVTGGQSPLARCLLFHRLDLGGEKRAVWASPELRIAGGRIELRRAPQQRFFSLALTSGAGLALSLFFLIRRGWRGGGWARGAGFVFAVVFLRQTLLGLYLGFCDGIIIGSNDDCQYFQIARDILDGRFHGQWHYTIGYPLLMAPFVLTLGGGGLDGMIEQFNLFNSFCVSGLCLALVFMIIRKVSGSDIRAFVTAALLAVLPFVYYPFEGWSGGCFRAFFAPPCFDVSSFRPYHLFHLTGFNALSDTPSALFVLLCVFLALRSRPGLAPLVFVSALFGFSCLIRINNIMFAPLLAWLFMRANKELLRDFSFAVRAPLVCAAAFLLVFGAQLWVNTLEFGSPLKFPYSLHGDKSSGGFLFSVIPFGVNFLLLCNLLYVASGLTGVVFTRDKVRRVFFSLWAFPLIVFFCGYPEIGNNPARFILPVYGALLGAFVCCDGWPRGQGALKEAAVIIIAAAVFLFVVPPIHKLGLKFRLQPFGLPMGARTTALLMSLAAAVPLISAAAAIVIFKGWQWPGTRLFILCFLMIFCAGFGMPLFILAVALLGWALSDAAREAWTDVIRFWLMRGGAQSQGRPPSLENGEDSPQKDAR